MKSFKLFLAIFCLLYIFDKIIYFSLSYIDQKVYTSGSIGKLNHFDKVKDTTKILFFGSSRTNHHIDPKYFGKSAFNVGFGGRKTAFSSALILTLPKTTFKQIVFLHLDPVYTFDTKYTGSDIDALYVKYHKNDVIKNKIDELEVSNPFSKVFWSLDYNGMTVSLITNYLKGNSNFKNYNGFDPMSNSSEQKEIFKKRLLNLKPADCPNNYTPSKVEINLLEEVKSFCKRNNKRLILITSPNYEDKCKKDNDALAKILKTRGFEYYDFTNLFDNDKNLDYWKDENHLSDIGAEKFSIVLSKKFKNSIDEIYTKK